LKEESHSDNEVDEAKEEGEKISKILDIANKSNNLDNGPANNEAK
jgi:hypothetical protein